MKFILIFAALVTLIITYRFTVLSSTPSIDSINGGSSKIEVGQVAPKEQVAEITLRDNANAVKAPLAEQDNVSAESIGLVTDPALIAQIEKDMQFTPAPEGDLSYMSPEDQTVQIDEPFPGRKPDPNMKLDESEISSQERDEQISRPLDPNTKMSDL